MRDRFVCGLLISLITLGLGSSAFGETLIAELHEDASAMPPLKGSQGYVLIGVDSGDTDSFLIAQRLEARGRIARLNRGVPIMSKKEHRIELANRETAFYFLVLPGGLYQFSEVNYPYFNLPFRLDTKTDLEWRFFVEPGKVNYIGRLVVAEERSEDTLDVNLLNRLAADYEQLRSTYAELFSAYPLAVGVGLRDDYFEFLTSP